MLTSLQAGLSDMLLRVFTGEEVMEIIATVVFKVEENPEELLEAISYEPGYTRGKQAMRWSVEVLAKD